VSRFLRSLMAVLTFVAFFGATTVQAMPFARTQAAAATAEAAMPADCPGHAAPAAPAKSPCDGLSLDCVKQLGCIGVASLPLVAPVASAVVAWTPAQWSVAEGTLHGRGLEPPDPPPNA
jgi:hypothetical protein